MPKAYRKNTQYLLRSFCPPTTKNSNPNSYLFSCYLNCRQNFHLPEHHNTLKCKLLNLGTWVVRLELIFCVSVMEQEHYQMKFMYYYFDNVINVRQFIKFWSETMAYPISDYNYRPKIIQSKNQNQNPHNKKMLQSPLQLPLSLFLLLVFIAPTTPNSPQPPHILKLAVMGTNDIHGTAFPKSLIRKDTRQEYKYGGLVYMARLINIIKDEYQGRAIYLDTGDQYQGGVQAGPQASKGEIIADFFNALDLKASALGNHEFDYGQQFLLNYLNFKNSSSLAANLFSETGQPDFLPNHKSSQIFLLQGIKLGVIGLATTQTPTTTSGFISNKFPQYQFHEYPSITIRQAKYLRERGAEIIVVLAHFGNKCPWNKTYDIRNSRTEQEPCQNDEVLQFVDALPEGTIDGILCGHRHQFAHHWYKGVPFMGAIDGGYYFNVMYFYFDTISRKVVDTEIEGPIPVCEKVFQNSKTCEFLTYEELEQAGPLTTWVFHQKQVHADKQVNEIFQQKYIPQMQKFTRKLVQNQLLLARTKQRQNPIANLITSLMIRAAEQQGHFPHFAVINHGAFRSTWYPGVIEDQHFYNMFPFENYLTVFQIRGAELVEMLRRVQNGWDGFYFLDGIFQTVSLKKIVADDDPDDFYYQKGFINATLLNGTSISPNTTYTGVTVQFLLHGGDDFIKAFGQYINPETKSPFPKLPVQNVRRIGEQRQLIYRELSQLGVIREEEWGVRGDRARMVVLEM